LGWGSQHTLPGWKQGVCSHDTYAGLGEHARSARPGCALWAPPTASVIGHTPPGVAGVVGFARIPGTIDHAGAGAVRRARFFTGPRAPRPTPTSAPPQPAVRTQAAPKDATDKGGGARRCLAPAIRSPSARACGPLATPARVIGPRPSRPARLIGPRSSRPARVIGPRPSRPARLIGPRSSRPARVIGPRSSRPARLIGPRAESSRFPPPGGESNPSR
jgi:hypothetical protein